MVVDKIKSLFEKEVIIYLFDDERRVTSLSIPESQFNDFQLIGNLEEATNPYTGAIQARAIDFEKEYILLFVDID